MGMMRFQGLADPAAPLGEHLVSCPAREWLLRSLLQVAEDAWDRGISEPHPGCEQRRLQYQLLLPRHGYGEGQYRDVVRAERPRH